MEKLYEITAKQLARALENLDAAENDEARAKLLGITLEEYRDDNESIDTVKGARLVLDYAVTL